MFKMQKMNYLSALLLIVLSLQTVFGCHRTPINLPHGRKSRGDNGYKLLISDSPNGYIPEKTYNLFLLGSRKYNNIQHFTHFTLTAEASNGTRDSIVSSPKRVGRFQLFSDSLTKFNENCINTISETDDFPKTEIQVMWVAPATGSGCVSLSAMVYENNRSWFADEGNLTKILCEEPNTEDVKKECCACDEAKYKFIFQGIWSNETHPKDFPFAIWLTHFSDVIGASHDTNFSFWGENHIAGDGFRSLAEWGSPTALENELRSKGPRLRSLIKAPGLWYPQVNTNTSAYFRVDIKHHKVSLVSMFGPSPDWVVGVNGLDLCLEDCSWKEELDIDLYPWDAGTDNGISYMSPNAETQPREKMYRITNMYPEDPRSPFYNPNSNNMIPLAKLYIRRDKIVPRNCNDEFLNALLTNAGENIEEQDTRGECEVTEYTEWSPCSVTCGKGLRMRSRLYKHPDKARNLGCTRQLIFKEMCVASTPDCGDVNVEEEEGENLAKSGILINEEGEGIGICKTLPWTNWSECSTTCGIGITMRTRNFYNLQGRKKCPHISIVEKQKCMKPECTFIEEEIPDPNCPVSTWSDWSPCTVTCGRGISIRTRLLLLEPHLQSECKWLKELFQQRECIINRNCTMNQQVTQEICHMSPEVGPCRGIYQRFAYNYKTNECQQFTYGGCRGNNNNFLIAEDCMQTCRAIIKDSRNGELSNDNNSSDDCILSDWTDWSPCNVSCGLGFSTKTRRIIHQSKYGGKPCPKKTLKRKRCMNEKCD